MPRGESVKLSMKDQTNTVMTMNTVSLTPRFSEVPGACQPLQPLQRFPTCPFQTKPGGRRIAGRPSSLLPEPRYASDLPPIPPLPFRRGEGRGEGEQRVHPLKRHPCFSAKRDRATPLAATLLCAALCLLSSPGRAATNDLTTALQRGLFEEEANQNLGAAIQAYQTVANQFDKDRKLAATAIFRLGECYRKQGNTNDAATQYDRILRDFSDQPTLVTLSRQNLAALGTAPVAPPAPVISDAARQEQKRLLEEEIKLVQKQLDAQQQQVQVAALPQSALWPTEREILKLKRQVAALDAGLPVSITATETLVPPTSTEAEEVKRIQALIKDSPDLINARAANSGGTPLHDAAYQDQLIVGEFLLANGADVGAKNGDGQTPLHAAAASGHKSMVELLLNHQASVQAVDNNGDTPLHLAAEHGYRSVVEALLAHSAEVNAKNSYGSTPLLMASAHGFKSVVDLLLAHGADINATTSYIYTTTKAFSGTPLCIAATRGDQPLVELLLSKGAQVNAEDKDGRTPLSLAAQNQSEPVVKHLLAAHANPNASRLDLPLAEAAFAGDITTLKLLLANGADPNTNSMFDRGVTARNTQSGGPGGRGVFGGGGAGGSFSKFTPLFLAVNQRHADAAKELLRCKADPNTSGPEGNPLLYEALSDAPTLKVLLEGGADPNVRTKEGTPLLLQAVYEKNQPAVELLLAHQADVNATNNNAANSDQGTPLHAAALMGNKAIAELLLKAGADVNARNKNGETPLYVAVGHRQRELAELLLANKADPNERNNAGQTPLDLAKSQAQSAPGQPLGAPRAFPGAMAVPYGALPGPAPLNYQWAPGTPAPAPAQESKPETMADLLRRHGAADDLPRLDCIEVRRPSANYSSTVFTKSTNNWSQFTLLDLIGVQCGFLAPSPQGERDTDSYNLRAFFNQYRPLPFPDLARLRIRRPAPNLKSWLDQTVDLRPVLEFGDCSKDARLEWGEVVEIPEADHPLNENWPGFSTVELANLKQCLTRQVEIVINGQATNITLAPQISNVGKEKEAANAASATGMSEESAVIARLMARRGGGSTTEPFMAAHTPFWLKPVLLQSKLVLTSSDLRHVKVTRHDAASGQERQWVVDCSETSPAPDLWLCNGDKIEVPEKAD